MEENKKQKHIAIFTGCDAPDPKDTANYWREHKIDAVIAADGGLDTCAKYNKYFNGDDELKTSFAASIVAGDCDSLSDMNAIPPDAEVKKCGRAKDLSDTEIALQEAHTIAGESGALITLVGGDGGRLDHLLSIYDTFSSPYRADVWLLKEQKAVFLPPDALAVLHGLKKDDIVSVARLAGKRYGGAFETKGLVWSGEHFRHEGMPSLSNWVKGECRLHAENGQAGSIPRSPSQKSKEMADGDETQGAPHECKVQIKAKGLQALVICPHWASVKIIKAKAYAPYQNQSGNAGKEALERQLSFSAEIDKMTAVSRRTMLLNLSRRENDAEHSWHIGMMALIFASYMTESADKEHACALCLAHDLVEIYAGDTFAFDKAGYATKKKREQDAAARLFSILPEGQGEEIRALWDEFEACETAESKLANCMDRLQPFLHNTMTGGYTWTEGKVKESDVLCRMEPIKKYMPGLWPWVEGKIADALECGWISQ